MKLIEKKFSYNGGGIIVKKAPNKDVWTLVLTEKRLYEVTWEEIQEFSKNGLDIKRIFENEKT